MTSSPLRPAAEPLPTPAGAHPWLLVAFLVPVFVGAIAWFWGRPWINSDTATGLLAWRHWLAGGPWNSVLEPDPANMARDVPLWLSWWSPGQYVWPGLFTSLGLSVGAAVVASSVVAAWIRSAGFCLLLLATGLSARTAALACAVEAANWHLFFSFGMYTGGEVVQAAIFPWMFFALFALRNHARWWLIAIPPLLFAGAFAKHSMLIAGTAGIGWLWWETNTRQRAPLARWFATAALLALALALGHAAINRWLVGPGPTPASSLSNDHGWHIAVGYPAFAPLSAATGLGSLVGRLFAILELPSNTGWQSLGRWLPLFVPVWLLVYALLIRHSPSATFRRLLATTLAAYLAAMTLLYLRGASVSIEDRHVRPAGMLLIAALAAVACSPAILPRGVRIGLCTFLFGIGGYGLAAELARAANLARLDCVGPSGISQPNLSRLAAAELVRRDLAAPAGEQLIFVGEPALALEIQRSRVICSDAIGRPLEWFQRRRWHGRLPHLVLVLPATWVGDPRVTALQTCFVDYASDDWHREIVGNCLFLSVSPRPAT